MHPRLSRALAVAGVATLAASGALLAAAPAQALPASVVFSDQNCDIDNGSGTVDGVDFTVTNATTEPGAIDYEIRIALGTTVVESTVLQPGESQRHVVELPEDVSTAVQIVNNAEGGGIIAGDTFTINCDPNSSPEATASIVADCLLPSGGIIAPSPGILFTLDNSEGTGPADYNFILDGESFESGVIPAGQTRQRSTSLTDEPGTAEVQSVDADGTPVTLFETDYDLDCNGPDPVEGYSPEATAAVTDASCALPTGGILVPTIPGVEFTLDNSEGTVGAAYEFVAGDVSVESGTVDAGETRVRSVSLVEDEVTLVQVISIGENGDPVVLAEREVVLDCVANVPTIDSPSDGEVLTEETVVISGTADGSDTVTVALAPADLVEGDFSAAAAAPLEGPVTFTVPVQNDGTYSVTTQLANDDYVATAVAARGESEGGLVEASVSAPSDPVAFSVAVVVDPGTGGGGDGGGDNGGGVGGDGSGTGGSGTGAAGSGGGALASTGSDAGLAVGLGALLALMGAGLVVGRRILRGARA